MAAMKKITADLIVPAIEPCLAFYEAQLGFKRTVEVPHGDGLGFVILVREGCELMLQSSASFAQDLPALKFERSATVLYIEVESLKAEKARLTEPPLLERTTPYGAREVVLRDPAGNVVMLAEQS